MSDRGMSFLRKAGTANTRMMFLEINESIEFVFAYPSMLRAADLVTNSRPNNLIDPVFVVVGEIIRGSMLILRQKNIKS